MANQKDVLPVGGIEKLTSEQLSRQNEFYSTMQELNASLKALLELFSLAKEELASQKSEVDVHREVLGRLDALLRQNKAISDSLKLLLELHQQHLPAIARGSRLTRPRERLSSDVFSKPQFSQPEEREGFEP
ncbi:hypothetical protein J4475_00100 [Candidatus Woesearchaeota archaeon]|nr:hypothetical protein [Candidatus Woesearchaeota archaeon]